MSETCPFCESPKLCPGSRYFACEYDSCGQYSRPAKCVAVQIAALTQRAEQAEAKLRRYESAETADAKVMVAAFNKLTAAEFREKRLREGIEWLEVDIRTADSLGSVDKQDEWEKFCAALLAQPSDAKEAEGGK